MVKLKVGKLGDSLGLILPPEAAERLQVGEGDTVYLTEAPGGFRLTSHDPEFEEQMTVARKIMRERRNALRELAKK